MDEIALNDQTEKKLYKEHTFTYIEYKNMVESSSTIVHYSFKKGVNWMEIKVVMSKLLSGGFY